MSFLLQSPSTIEGIGPQRASALSNVGIETIADMFAARAPRIASLLPNVSPTQIGGWFCAAVLMRVEDVNPNIAEAFVNAGVRSVSQLAEAGLRTLELAIKDAREGNRMQEDISLYKLAELQRNAWRTRDRGMLAGRVLAGDGTPITGAVIDIGRQETTVDASGRYAFDRVPEGRVMPIITLPGRQRALTGLPHEIRAAKLVGPIVHRLPTPGSPSLPLLELHEIDGELFVHTSRYRNRQVTLPLSEFRERTYFLVRAFEANGAARLLSLYKRRSEPVTFIERCLAAPGSLPGSLAVGEVLLLQGGSLVRTSLTSADVADLRRQKWLDTHPEASRQVIEVSLT